MLSLSKQYSFATSEVQKDALLSATQAILATNDPLATFPRTSAYVSLLLIALATLLFSVLMLSTNRIYRHCRIVCKWLQLGILPDFHSDTFVSSVSLSGYGWSVLF